MTRTILVALTIALALLAAVPNASADSFTFTLLPSDSATALPAGTLGFGYSIFNDSAVSLVFNAPADIVVADLDPSVITLDSSIFDFPTIDPGGTLSVNYVPGLSGLFELIWDAAAPIGFSTTGTAFLSGQFCADPSDITSCSDAVEQTASFHASVSQPGGTNVPEPSSLMLLVCGVVFLGTLSRRVRGVAQRNNLGATR